MLLWWRRRDKPKPKSLYGNLIAYMKDTLRNQPGNHSLRLSLVAHLQKAGRYEEAIGELLILLGQDPSHRKAKGLLLRLRLEQRLALINRGSV